MAINYVKGQILADNLERDGIDLSISNANVGINTVSPAQRLDVNGNILANNIFSNFTVSAVGNVTGGNILTAGLISATGNVTGGNVLTSGVVSAAVSINLGSSTGFLDAATNNDFIGITKTSGDITVGSLSQTGTILVGRSVASQTVNVASGVTSTGNTKTVNIGTAGAAGSTTTVAIGPTAGNGTATFNTGTTVAIANISGTALSVTGNIVAGNLRATTLSATGNILTGNIINPAVGNISVGNVNINDLVNPVANSDAATKFYVDQAVGSVSGNVLGNLIQMGTNSQGALVSNAVTLTTATSVTNGIALLNQVLGKLVPPAPPTFPASQSLAIASVSSYRMANITQVNNTANSLTVAAGATVSTVRRAATYTTNTISTAGPGDSGTISLFRNGSNIANVTLNPNASPTANGTYNSNLVITNNFDYNSANANITAGFWYVFSAAVSGSNAPAGWNDLIITDSAAGNSNVAAWYYDASSPSTPSFTSTTMVESANTLSYSSTVPHYTSATQFTIGTTVANISGNMYPTSNVLASGVAGGSFAAPVSVNYNASNIGSNILNAFQSASFTTTANVTTGFGGSSTGPQVTVNNSYSTGTLTLTTALGNTVLRKTGNATAVDEGNVVVTSVGTGSGNAFRIVSPGSGNTPVYTANATAFNSQSSTLQTYDATVIGTSSQGVLKHDQTNYATGYLPVGPDLSVGRSGTQYFTFKFVRTNVSKFDITYAGNVAGLWVALPGSLIDSTSSANGWINMATAYAGAGVPGANIGAGGNGSDGCALGGVVQLNTTVASTNRTCTFGTVSSSSTSTNEIYVRVALTSGQTVTALAINTASN